MTVDDDPRLFYFTLGSLVRDLPDTGLLRVGQMLRTPMPGRDWRAIGDLLGYTMTQMDPFDHRPTPGYELLRDWSTRSGATIRVLQSKLQQITRHDIVSALDEIRQNPITLEVVIHDSSPPFDTPLTPEIRGRKELWDGLMDLLKSHVAAVTSDLRYTLFILRDTCMSWQGKCREYQGQQIDVNVRHQNTTTSTGSAPGFCVRELQPSWHLMSPTQLRYTRNMDCNVEAGTTSPNGAGARPSSGSFGPDTDAKGTGRQDARAGRESGNSGGYKSCIRESSCNMDSAESLEKLKTKVTFSSKEESSGDFHRIKDLFTQKSARYIPETVKTKFDLEDASVSLNIDLRSCEGPPDRRKVSHHENTRTKPINFNLRSDETLPENLEADVALFGSESPTICLKSDDSLSENFLSDVRDQQICSSAMVAMARSSSAAGPGDASGQELMELNVRLDDLRLENESSVSGGFVKEEETKGQQPNSITRRHVYFLPKAELVRSQFPGLWDLPGFHPKLKHKISLISEVMKPYETKDGWYLIRAFGSDDNMAKVDLALTVTHKGKLKHFMILQLLCGSIHRRYFLFSRDFEAKSISDLIDHYKQHPLIPGSLSARGTNFPRLISPIPRDSFNYM